MCGIIGFIPKTKGAAPEAIVNQFQEQHHRGKEGFGLIEVNKTLKPTVQRATEPVKALLDIRMSKADMLLFHHRHPTSTDNKMKQTHPFFIHHDELKHDYMVIHNGVIRNDDELFKLHTEEYGYIYSTYEPPTEYHGQYSTYKRPGKFNDSEAFAIAISRYLEGLDKELDVQGTVAFMALRLNKKTGKADKYIYGRNSGNPLDLLETDAGLLLASSIFSSEAEILPPDTFEVIDLKDIYGKEPVVDILSSGMIKSFELKFKELPKPAVTTSAQSMGFGTPRSNTSVGKTTEINEPPEAEDDEDDRFAGNSARANAFLRMSDRVIRDIAIDIESLFETMAYYPVTEDEATQLASDIKDLIMEKEELANSKVRPLFDELEEREEAEAEFYRGEADVDIDDPTLYSLRDDDDIPEPTEAELAAIADQDEEHQGSFLRNLLA